MSSIGVDFKLKYVEVDGKKIKLQIVSIKFFLIISGTLLDKNVFEQSPLLTTENLSALLLYMTSPKNRHFCQYKSGSMK